MMSRNRGFSMLEVLVALVISLVTLMGAAGLVVRTVQQEVESLQRLQALTLIQGMVDKININRRVVACYSNGATGITVGKGVTQGNLPSCTMTALVLDGDTVAISQTERDRADADIDEWHDLLLGTSEKKGSDNVGAMIDARGCIVAVNAADRLYRVTVAWQGMSDTVEPASACGDGLYTSDESRRAVSLLVRVGDLT